MIDAASVPPPDRRRSAWRDDLADERLRGRVPATRFVTSTTAVVAAPVLGVRKAPDKTRGLETELLFGEMVDVFEQVDGWSWVQSQADGYVGYVASAGLTAQAPAPTHRVRAIGTFVYARPDIKSPPILALSIGCRVAVGEIQDRFAALATGGFVMAHHLMALDAGVLDFVDVAERLLGTPYLWGGRSRLGLDCSGLLQVSMQAAALPCPRDSDMQRQEVGHDRPVPKTLSEPDAISADVEGLERGDLLFWPGHVAIATDGHMLIHANGHHMSTVVEPILEAAVRIYRQTGDGVTALKRPSRLGAKAAGA
jgi:cell wall-associated NlpC family hydrolase